MITKKPTVARKNLLVKNRDILFNALRGRLGACACTGSFSGTKSTNSSIAKVDLSDECADGCRAMHYNKRVRRKADAISTKAGLKIISYQI